MLKNHKISQYQRIIVYKSIMDPYPQYPIIRKY